MTDEGAASEAARTEVARRPLLQHSTIAEPLKDERLLQEMGLLGKDVRGTIPVVLELNLRHEQGLEGAKEALRGLMRNVVKRRAGRQKLDVIADIYVRAFLTLAEVRELVNRDTFVQPDADEVVPPGRRALYRVWPDFPVEPLIYRSVTTVKADAARRSFAATGKGIVWAVVDSGIDRQHPHFRTYNTLDHPEVAGLHQDFTGGNSPLTDELGHGTHVAGIIAGALPPTDCDFRIFEEVRADASDTGTSSRLEDRTALVEDRALLAGVAPQTRLVSLKVLDADGRGSSMTIVRALEYVRREVNGSSSKLPRVHGVNLSVGYEFLAEWFACGQSPLCDEVNRLVRSGVVVVVAAGNTGYGTLSTRARRETKTGLALTINDPGNAELAITVGATHRDMPHTYGVSYFSSKGPTGDGRAKPDLVAPGERITSCAAGKRFVKIGAPAEAGNIAYYIDETGTSMAAPHASGAIAAFLSIRREYIGQPDRVKKIFMDSAVSLGREPYFQGRGMVDLMHAIQSV